VSFEAIHPPVPTISPIASSYRYVELAKPILRMLSWHVIRNLHSIFEVAGVAHEPVSIAGNSHVQTTMAVRPAESMNTAWAHNEFRLYLIAYTSNRDGSMPWLQIIARLGNDVVDLQDNTIPIIVPPGRTYRLEATLDEDESDRVALLATQLHLMLTHRMLDDMNLSPRDDKVT
jgi:hypothetical protein